MNGTLPYSIGLKITDANGTCCKNILVKGITLPTYVRQNIKAASDAQASVEIEVLKNDSCSETVPAENCTVLGNFSMKLPEEISAGEDIELIFTAGLNGLLICSCKCKGSMTEKTIDL